MRQGEWFCRLLPRGATWWVGTRNPITHVRGYVRHPDHKTVHLPGRHRVVPNATSGAFLSFFD